MCIRYSLNIQQYLINSYDTGSNYRRNGTAHQCQGIGDSFLQTTGSTIPELARYAGSLSCCEERLRQAIMPEYLVSRQPFPGPGLGIRIIGEVTPEKVAIVQDADAIWREEIARCV